MANTVLNPTIIAKAAVRILDNELVMANRVYRAYENEYSKKINGYEAGDTISIRKPNQFTVRTGPTAAIQDVTEGKLTMQVATQKGVDFKFTSAELTMKIEELADRVIKPAMVQLANDVDRSVASLYSDVYNVVGTVAAPSNVDTFLKFSKAAERMDLTAVPQDERVAVLGPTDTWALAASQTALFVNGIANPAYRNGDIGKIGGVETYMSQNAPNHTKGLAAGPGVVNGAGQAVTYAAVLNTESVPGIQSLITNTWTAATTFKKGDVFTIGALGTTGLQALNPITKAVLPYLQQFVVQADVTADGTGNATLSIAPAIIVPGTAFSTVSQAPGAGAVITFVGAAGAVTWANDLVFHKNAFALAVVPMVKPPGSVDCARESYKGLSVRLIPYYDGTNDVSNYRLDILYGFKTVDPRLAVRLFG